MPTESQPSAPAITATPGRFCKKCGYPLIGLESRICPECGRAFDPANRKTFAKKPPRGWVWRWGKRLALLALLFLLTTAGGIGWLWRGWHAEQPTIARLRTLHQSFHVAPIGPKRLQEMLGKRWEYLAERVDRVELLRLSAADTEALDVRSLTQLESLRLLDCEVSQSTLNRLAGLQKLQTLSLWNVKTEKLDLGLLKKLPALSVLALWRESPGRAGLEHIGRLKRLRILGLSDNGLTNADLQPLEGLSSLEAFDLGHNPITDAGLEHLQGLKSLKQLYVGTELLNTPGMARLKQALPSLQVIGY